MLPAYDYCYSCSVIQCDVLRTYEYVSDRSSQERKLLYQLGKDLHRKRWRETVIIRSIGAFMAYLHVSFVSKEAH